MQKKIPVAVLVKGSSAVCHWKGKFASISKSHGAKTAYGAGHRNSRWRPAAIFKHEFRHNLGSRLHSHEFSVAIPMFP